MTEPQTVVGGRYELRRKIAEGGMGSVHEAVHLLSRRVVALKLLTPDVNRDEAKHQRFLREVSAPAQIGHDGIVEVIDAGYDDKLGALYVAMEMLDGETLSDRIEKLSPGTNPEHREQLLRIFDELLDPLAAAHAKGIVHRDLKPENVFLHRRRDGKEMVKVLDFGIARDLDEGAQSVTRTGIAMGTPHYMAPEQAMNAREASFPADVWALGAILYESVCGTLPFPGDTVGEILAAAVTTPHRPITAITPDVPAPLVALIDRCLAKRPEDRPRDVGVLRDEFRRVRGDAARASALPTANAVGAVAPTLALESPLSSAGTPAPSSFGSVSSAPGAGTPAPLGPPSSFGATASSPGAPSFGTQNSSFGAGGGSAGGAGAGGASKPSRLGLYIGVGVLTVVLAGGCCLLSSVAGIGILGTRGSERTQGGGTTVGNGAGSGSGLGNGQTITRQGRLEPTDARLTSGEFRDTFQESFPAGARVSIRARSTEFDTYLIVVSPQGSQIDNDDLEGRNAGVDIPSAQPGVYQIIVTSFAPGEMGGYTLSISTH